MKRNSSVFCVFLAVLTALPACTNDDFTPRPVHPSLPGSITIAVTDGGYVFSSEPKNRGAVTRAVENDYATEFTAGDKIGVFAIEINSVNSRSFIYENLCFVYNGKTWVSENGSELSHTPQPGSRIYYFSYYPYRSDMTGKYNISATDSNGVKTTKADKFFSELIASWYPAADQSTYDAYNASDLMVAEGELTPSANGFVLTFKMEHQMGLLILDLPGTEYTYTEAVSGVEQEKSYPLYTGVSLPNRFWRKDRYSARTIIKSKTPFSSGSCSYYNDELEQRFFQISDEELLPGWYKHYTVDGGEVKKVSRPLKEGDYYMDDGGIVPNEKVQNVSSMPAGKCLGVVFWVGEKEGIHWTQSGAQEGDHLLMADHPGCTRGMVVGLKDAQSSCAWSSNVSSGLWDWADSFSFPAGEQKKVEMIRSSNALFGYNRSLLFPLYKGANSTADFLAYESVKTYASANPAPEGSSGWFLPGQYELATMCFGMPSSYTVEGNAYYFENLVMKQKLDSWLRSAGGDELLGTYWSSSEDDDKGESAWCVDLSVPSYGFEAKNSNSKVRPVLAF